MPLESFNWNVVVVGRWNRAILTPLGIAKHVFCIEGETPPMEVLVPLDGVSPYLVKHSDISVAVDHERLIAKLEKTDYKTLAVAMKAGQSVLRNLPVTPVTAAGFNVNFRVTDPSDMHFDTVGGGIDDSLSALPYEISERGISRCLAYGDGSIKLTCLAGADDYQLLFNFHRTSQDHDELSLWLGTDVEEIEQVTRDIAGTLGLELEESGHDANGQ